MTVVFQWSFDRGFLGYVNTVENEQLQKIAYDLEELYKERRSWEWIPGSPEEILIIIVNSYPEGEQKERFIKHLKERNIGKKFIAAGPLPKDIPVHSARRVYLLDQDKNTLFGYEQAETDHN